MGIVIIAPSGLLPDDWATLHILDARPLTLTKLRLSMAIIDGVLDIVLRNPFADKSKFFKKSQYVFGPRFILGTVFAFIGVFGFATSGLVWEFKGTELGLTALITSFIALLFGLVFLFPSSNSKPVSSVSQNNIVRVTASSVQEKSETSQVDEAKSVLTTSEEIRKQLALSEKSKPEVVLVNFSTNHLLPGNSLRPSRRKAGKSLDAFRETAKSLFKSEA